MLFVRLIIGVLLVRLTLESVISQTGKGNVLLGFKLMA
jgi:hypothetical protein